MTRLFLVSNRGCALDAGQPAAGGLATGLLPALEAKSGIWLSWSGSVADATSSECERHRCNGFTRAVFDLSERAYGGYYLGFANQVLWPALHGRTDLIRFEAEDYETYVGVNRTFARHVLAQLRDDDVVWVHDYHLMPLGRELRAREVAQPIGYFLHAPFPGADAMAAVPRHKELIRSLLAYDLIGFQSRNDLANFLDYARRHLESTVHSDGTLAAFGRRIQAGVFPIGIDARGFAALSRSPEAQKLAHRFAPCFREHFGIVGAERLDYSKGLPARMHAFARLIEDYPKYRRSAFLMQVAAPSREALHDYAELKAELEALAGTINGQYGDLDWTPVRFVNRTFSQAKLAALFRASRVGMVTPLRDGMNLVAKEYVAAQDPQDPGVLVLSCFAGAAEELTGALVVNPYDIDAMADALHRAIEMPLEERRARWRKAMTTIERQDVHAWSAGFLAALTQRRQSGEAGPVVPPDRRVALLAAPSPAGHKPWASAL